MVTQPSPLSDENQPEIRRGRVGSIDLYEVKENELELLERGSSPNLQFNFAIFLFSCVVTFVIAWATSGLKSEKVELIFTIVSIIAFLAGVYLMLCWWQSRQPIKEVVKTIRNRINHDTIEPPDGSGVQPKMPDDHLRNLLKKEADRLASLQQSIVKIKSKE